QLVEADVRVVFRVHVDSEGRGARGGHPGLIRAGRRVETSCLDLVEGGVDTVDAGRAPDSDDSSIVGVDRIQIGSLCFLGHFDFLPTLGYCVSRRGLRLPHGSRFGLCTGQIYGFRYSQNSTVNDARYRPVGGSRSSPL